MLWTRVSHLESFRRCVSTQYGNEDELAAALSGQPFAPNAAMLRGTEFHRLVASQDHNVVRYGIPRDEEPSPFKFHGEDILAARRYIGEGLWEVEGRKIFDLPLSADIEVKGQADWLLGPMVQDQKTKGSQPDPRDYEASLQWRFYLAIHGCDVFRYNLFWFDEPDAGGWSRFREVCSVSFWRYPQMERDCRDWLCRFVDWAERRDLRLVEKP